MLKLADIRQSKDLTDLLYKTDEGKALLREIGQSAIHGYQIDEKSRAEWKAVVDKAMDIAKQVQDKKNFPWPNASNIKFPLITEAAIDFASRTLPEIIPNDRVVKMLVTGSDPTSGKYLRGERVADCMSYQLLSSEDWEDGTDKLLHILPVVGTAFKKTYYSVLQKRNISEVCPPDKIVVNYNTQSLESARRITHCITMSINDIIQRQRSGMFCEYVDVEELRPEGLDCRDNDYEIELLEQHCWLDLDDDGYKEPYVVTVHERTAHVLRIVQRIKEIKKNSKKEIVEIIPWQHFTDFHFIRSPDGGFYSIGFGQLLLPLNRGINSLFNQLIDAGTLSVTQGGFLGKGLRIRDKEYSFKPFEWKILDTAAGTDIADNVFPFPVREPSQTLFNLLGMMIQIGKDLSSSTEAMKGKNSGTNVSQGVQNSLIEQGSKIFAAINKRLYRSLTKEFRKLYELNHHYLTDSEYMNILDLPNISVKMDFDLESNDVTPIADPMLSSLTQRMAKAQALQMLKTGDMRAVDMYMLRTLKFDEKEIQEMLPPKDPNAPPPPADQKMMAEAAESQAKAQNMTLQNQILVAKAPLDAQMIDAQIKQADALVNESAARVWKMQKDAAHGDQKIALAGGKMQMQETLKQSLAQHTVNKDAADFALTSQQLEQKAMKDAGELMLKNKEIDKKAEMAEKAENKKGEE